MRKRLVAAFIAILCVVGLLGFSPKSVFASTEDDIQITGEVDNQDSLKSEMTSVVESYWNAQNWNDIVKQYASQMESEDLEKFTAWGELQASVGEYDKILSMDFTNAAADKDASATMVVNYEKGKVQFTCLVENGSVQDVEVAAYKEDEAASSFGARMSKAGINTVMSICIVFVVLIFIACIISLFIFISKLEGFLSGKNKEADAPKTAPVVEAAPVAEDVTDDTELVAVITAAIMASMGDEAPADGLRIASIKRRTGSKWKRS